MKSDLENQQSSVNDMLEQIKKIMSQEQVNTPNDLEEHQEKNEDNILELSEDLVIENEKPEAEISPEKQENLKSIPNDLFNEIDRLVTSSDINIASNIEKSDTFSKEAKTANEAQVNPILMGNNKSSADQDTQDSLQEKNTLKTQINETTINTVENSNQTSADEKRNNLVADSVVKESAQVIRELIGVIDKPVNDGLKFRNGSTVEELVVEIMKPQIAEWLNANLSTIVKRVVEKEVRKLIPKEED